MKNKCKYWIGIVLIIVLIVTCTLIINSKINEYEEKVPYEVCHDEESIEKVNVYAIEYIPFNLHSDYCRLYVGEVTCEDGVVIHEYSNKLCNFGDEDKVCLIKTVTEVCEIIYP